MDPAGPGIDWLDDIMAEQSLPKAQNRVAEVIIRNPQLASYAEIAEIDRQIPFYIEPK